MVYRTSLVLLSTFMCSTSMAALNVFDTRNNSVLVDRTYTYANAAGDLRIDVRPYGSSSSAVSAASNSLPTVKYHLLDIEESILSQSEGQAIVILEGDNCRRMTADSAAPAVLGGPGMNLGGTNKELADGMKQAGSAIEQAIEQAGKEGMTAEQQLKLKELTKAFTEPQAIKPRDTLQLEPLGEHTRVGQYYAEGFRVTDLDGNEKHRVWVVPTPEVAGGDHVRRAMLGMLNTYKKYLDNIGGGALMDTGLDTMFSKGALAGKTAVRIKDVESGDVSDIVEAHHNGDADVDYYPKCNETAMFGM